MTLRHLRIFVEVCRTGSITKAAESLHLSQPAVSLAIRQLEDYYGILLFDRISKKLYLPESGNKMLSYASHIIESFDDMETQLKNWDSAGTLRIGSSISTGTQMLPQLVRRFNLRFPQIRTQVLIDNSRIIEDKVLTNQLDLALVESLSYSPDIVCVPFYTDRLIVITAPKHPLTQNPECTVKALADYPVLLREPGSGTREVVDALLVTAEVQITPLWESTSTRSIINAVKENIGISILPYELVKNEIQSGAVAGLPLASPLPNRTCSIIHHRNKYLTPSAQAFIEVCQEYSNLSTESFQTEEERQSSTE